MEKIYFAIPLLHIHTYVYNVSNMNSLNTILKKLYHSFSQAVYSKEAQWSKKYQRSKKRFIFKNQIEVIVQQPVYKQFLCTILPFLVYCGKTENLYIIIWFEKRLRSKRFASCQFNWNSKPVKILHAREYYIGMEDLVNIIEWGENFGVCRCQF